MIPALFRICLFLATLSGCGFSGPTPREVLREPAEFHGRDVTVEGQMGTVSHLAEFGVFVYPLWIGSDSLLVLDPSEPVGPSKLEGSLRVSGRIHKQFVLGGRARVVLLRGLDL